MIPEQTLEALTNGFGHMGSASVDLKTAHTDTFSASVDPANDRPSRAAHHYQRGDREHWHT